MASPDTDVLMITYKRPTYTRLALAELLARSSDRVRVWVWHNGDHEETLRVVQSFLDHPQLHRFHHSKQNVRLTEPTNWLWENATGDYLSKVDDDCIVPLEWDIKLREAHEAEDRFGIIGCWRFQPEDFDEDLSRPKIRTFSGGHQLLLNMWVEGSGYLMKRQCREQMGLLRGHQTFTTYCIQAACAGWHNGWVFPFLYQEHMDDPRAEHSELKSDEDLTEVLPLSAQVNGVTSLVEWQEQLRRSARIVQSAPYSRFYWSKPRRLLRRALVNLRILLSSNKRQW